MRYIKEFEKSNDELKRNYIGKYTIIKVKASDLALIHDNDKPMCFLIYVVPGTCDGYQYKTYTEIIVGYKDLNVKIFNSEENIKRIYIINSEENKKRIYINSVYILNLSLSYIDHVALYTTKKYDDAIEKLGIIDEINKYNL
jgi:hypothetical protein